MISRLFLLSIIFSTIVSCTGKVKLGHDSIDLQKMAKDIEVLASDSLLGRAPLSPGEERTIRYLKERMEAIGLEPVFGSSFLQKVPLVEITTSLPSKMALRLSKTTIELKTGIDYTAWSQSLENVIDINGSQLVFAGFGINAPEWAWNDFEGLDLCGKILVVLVNDPGFVSRDTTLFKGETMTYYGRWRYKFEEAERQGALGCLIVHEDIAAGYPWGVVNGRTNRPDFFLDDQSLLTKKCKLQGWLTLSAAQKLFYQLGLNYNHLKRMASQRGFKPIALNANVSIQMQNDWKKSVSQNVAGYIKGSKYPTESIVYCAHWDHLGVRKPFDGDSIYNGASDNAAAIAWMLAIAEAYKSVGKTPERSVVFFSPTAEEAGMLGSEYFVANSPLPIEKTVACFNNDVILMIGRFSDVTVTGLGHSELDQLLGQEAQKQGRYICNDPNPENGMFFRSDQLPFLKAGVPSLFAKGYSHQTELGKVKTQELIDFYWKHTYHKPSDHYNASEHNLEGLKQDAQLFFNLGWRLSNNQKWPHWNKDSEFYKIR